MISPTVGRVVLFFGDGEGPLASIVTRVWNDRLVNLAVFDRMGCNFGRTSVRLLQDDEKPQGESAWCEWMPFQKGQAAKTDDLVNDLNRRVGLIETHFAP